MVKCFAKIAAHIFIGKMFDTQDSSIYERRKSEPIIWYSRFEEYRLMGPTRSILAIYKRECEKRVKRKGLEKAGKGLIKAVPSSWAVAAEKWQWRKRAEAWDEDEIEERRRKWQKHAESDRDCEHKTGDELMKRANDMLGYALAHIEYPTDFRVITDVKQKRELLAQIRELEEGKNSNISERDIVIVQTTTIKPIRWSMRDAAELARIGSLLKRQATGSPTSYDQSELTLNAKNNKGQPQSLFPIKSIIIESAPKRELLENQNGDGDLTSDKD